MNMMMAGRRYYCCNGGCAAAVTDDSVGHNRSCSSYVGGGMASQVGIGGASGVEGQHSIGR